MQLYNVTFEKLKTDVKRILLEKVWGSAYESPELRAAMRAQRVSHYDNTSKICAIGVRAGQWYKSHIYTQRYLPIASD